MKLYKISQKKEYPLASSIVDGLEVIDHVDNMGSIDSSLSNYVILDGIREVPMADFHITGRHYSVQGSDKIARLQREIAASGQIMPLIVVVDKEGPYILEGSTRIDALFNLGKKSFPAIVVEDKDENI